MIGYAAGHSLARAGANLMLVDINAEGCAVDHPSLSDSESYSQATPARVCFRTSCIPWPGASALRIWPVAGNSFGS